MSRLTAAALIAALAVVAACTAERTFNWVGPDQAGQTSVQYSVVDRTGTVADAGEALMPALPGQDVRNPPDRPDVVQVSWTGGTCDEAATLVIERRGDGLAITRTLKHGFGGCFMDAIPRSIDIRFDTPVPAAAVVVRDAIEGGG